MAQEDRSARKRKGRGRPLEMFLDWAIIIVCLLLIAFALRSYACRAARGDDAPSASATRRRSLSAGTHPTKISQVPLAARNGAKCQRGIREFAGATLPIGGDLQKADPLVLLSTREIHAAFPRTMARTVFCPFSSSVGLRPTAPRPSGVAPGNPLSS